MMTNSHDPAIPLDDLSLRKAFIGLDDQDFQRLKQCLPANSPLLAEVSDALVAHLSQFDIPRSCFQQPEQVKRLQQQEQIDCFRTLFQGPHDENFFRQRLAVGQRHHEIGLRPEWYIGAFCHYLVGMIRRIHDSQGEDALENSISFIKMALFDISLTTEAYFRSEHEQLSLLSTVFEDNIEGVVIIDKQGIIRHANKMSGQLTGIPSALLAGVPFIDLVNAGMDSASFGAICTRSTVENQWHGELELLRARDHAFPAEVTLMRVNTADDSPPQWVIEFTDITEKNAPKPTSSPEPRNWPAPIMTWNSLPMWLPTIFRNR